MGLVFLVILLLRLVYLLKFGDIIYWLIVRRSLIRNFHGLILYRKITVNF
jgi:hypothetical protein